MIRASIVGLLLAMGGLAQIVEGTVSDAVTNAPLGGAKISIERGGKVVRVALSDGQGGFRVEGIAAGEYTATFSARGYEEPAQGDAVLKPFLVTGDGSGVRLDARMTPMGKVAGRVVDGDGGPVAGAIVQLLGSRTGYGATTGREGKFSFDEVPADVYRLWTQAPQSLKAPLAQGGERMAWVSTFFPGVADASAAGSLVVRAGSEVWEEAIHLQAARVHRIRGVLLDAGGSPVQGIRVTLGSNQGIWMKPEDRERYTVADGEGSFEFADVTDGTWRLSAELEKDGGKLRAFTAEKMAGHDLDRTQLRLNPPFTVRGTVVREAPAGGPGKKARMLVLLTPDGGGSVNHQAAASEDGQFQIDGVYPGQYIVRPISPGAPYYLASITLGEREIPYQQPIDLMSGALPLTIVYKSNGGGVRGTVENCGAATVVFYPQDARLQISEFKRRAICGEGGHFEIAHMRPGEYYGLAFDRAPGLDEMFVGLDLDQGLINRAIRVTVRPGEFTAGDLRVTRR